MSTPTETKKITRPKYTAADRFRVFERLRTLVNEGLSDILIAEKMNKDGFRRPNGKLLRATNIATLRAQGKFEAPVAPSTGSSSSRGSLPNTVIAILTDPSLSDSQKIRMVLAYADERNA